MSLLPESLEAPQVVEVNWADRWQVYHRLQELAIPCECEMSQPLRVNINDSITAIQVWSVCQQLLAPRNNLISWLQRCWQNS